MWIGRQQTAGGKDNVPLVFRLMLPSILPMLRLFFIDFILASCF